MPQEKRRNCYLYVDECHHYVSTSFASMIPQVHKFGLGLWLATQHLEQLEPNTKAAILANFGTFLVFRVGLDDAKTMAKLFYPIFSYDDFTSLPRYHLYMKLLINGTESRGFSAIAVDGF